MNTEQKPSLPQDVALDFELKSLEAGPVIFPGLGEIDLSKISMAQAIEINKLRPGILVKKTQEKPAAKS